MENAYYLAVQIKPNNYFPIKLQDLSIAHNLDCEKLEEIDAFTLKFSEEEIIQAIKKANLLQVSSDMKLVIIYKEKNNIRKIPVMTKDISFDMWDYLKVNFSKDLSNKVYNFLKSKVQDNLDLALTQKELLEMVSRIDYLNQRKLYWYLYER